MSISLDSFTFPNIPDLDTKRNNNGPPVTGPSNIVGSNNTGSYGGFNGAVPLSLIIITIIIIAYYVLFSSLGNESTDNGNGGSGNKMIELLLWGLFILLILLNGVSYIFSYDIIASIKNIFSPETNVDIKVKHKNDDNGDDLLSKAGSKLLRKKEVFHVSDNKYNYEDAKAICKAYDGRIATYNELNKAYNEGADWCGYGWSDNQMALFPTQEEKWNTLQKIDGHQHDCGRPGINGGFIKNPNVKFGVNCYGFKPEITSEEAENMKNNQVYPKTEKERMFDQKVDYWRENLPNVILSPFNSDNWSVI